MAKAPKGTVVIQTIRGRLCLVWSFAGQRYFLSLNLPDTSVNRNAAVFKAKLIERDIANDLFDPTLKKYKPETGQSGALSVVQLFERFKQWKATKIDPRTIEKYQCLKVRLVEYFGSRSVSLIREREAEQFRDWMLERMKAVTVQDRLSLLRACYRWGMKQDLVKANPWEDVKLKVPPKQAPKPFTLEEIKLLIKTFRESRYYAHYADYVEFLFGTGCRSGEAIGLRWKHVADDCSSCWVGEIVTRNKRKDPNSDRLLLIPGWKRLLGLSF